MPENPYTSPTSDASDSVQAVPQTLGVIAKSTFLAWERLRVIYIILLGLLTLLLAGPELLRLRTMVMIVEGAIVANVCYFAGPTMETYVRWLGYRGKWLRWFLFISGTLVSAVLAIAAMASMLLPNQN